MALADDGEAGDRLVGATLQSRYRLNRLIGRGGMGAVYEGVQVPLNKRVAVKVMARQLAANEEALARFRREADVTSQLGHPHIVQVFDFGETATGEPYLVMEYLEGEDLERRLARDGRLPLAAALNILRQVASALAETHARGIVHRDLKPGNVFLQRVAGEEDFVKVVDFGVSKAQMATKRLTGENVLLGTPSYMAPEQANGRIDEIDRRTDEWSLACIAYEMLAGHPPFRGDDPAAVIQQIIYQTPPAVTQAAPEVPAGVAQVLARALSKEPGDRFPTVPAFVRALEAVAAGRSIPTDEVNITPARAAAGESAAVPPGGAATTTLSNAAAEISRRSRGAARAPLGIYFAAVTVAAAAALVLLVLRARSPAVAGQRAERPAATLPDPARAQIPTPVEIPAPPREPPPPLAPAAVEPTPPRRESSPSQPPAVAHVPAVAPHASPGPSERRPTPHTKLHLIQDL